jgi:hypothetical protein
MRYRTGFLLIWILLSTYARNGNAQPPTPIEKNGKWGYAGENNKLVINAIYFMATAFNKFGIASVVDDSGWVYIDTSGCKLVRPYIYDNGPDYYVEGLSRYIDKNKMGFINREAKIVIDARFEFVRPFSEGRAAFCEGCTFIRQGEHGIYAGGRWGYIDKSGNKIIPAQYDRVFDFEGRKAIVIKNEQKKTIDMNGNVLF